MLYSGNQIRAMERISGIKLSEEQKNTLLLYQQRYEGSLKEIELDRSGNIYTLAGSEKHTIYMNGKMGYGHDKNKYPQANKFKEIMDV